MNQELEKISETARGLLFRSETDYPLKTFMLNRTGNLVGALKSYSGQDEDAPVEKTSLDHFFRNMVKIFPGYGPEQISNAERFQDLEEALKEHLTGIEVYRIGVIQVDAFILGQLKDGSYAGLWTKLVET